MNKGIPKSKTRLYRIWSGMKARCNNEKSPNYKYYGAKGIKLFPEWENDFEAFRKWSYDNGYKEKYTDSHGDSLSIDRIDPSKGYFPENCRWITVRENTARAALSRDEAIVRKATFKGFRSWYEKWSGKHDAEKRVAIFNEIMALLLNLNNLELDRFRCMLSNYLIATEEGWNPDKYFEHGFHPPK